MNICVFGSSSKSTNQLFIDESYKLGELIAKYNYTCVNGGGRYGCMGGLNNGCHSKGGKIVGIIHQKFCVDTSEHPTIKDLVIVDGNDLHKRKLELFQNADCLLVLPGGVGTFDELFDGVAAKSLGMKDMNKKPFCLVNINGFYDGIILQMKRAYEDHILYHKIEDYFHVEPNIDDAFHWCVKEVLNSSKENKMSLFDRVVARNINPITTTTTNDDNNIKDSKEDSNHKVVSFQRNSNSNYYILLITAFTIGLFAGSYYNHK